MTFLKFDDNRISKAFNRIAKMDNDSKRIDSDREREAIASLISGVSHQISKHDLALLKSESLNFDNKKVKNDFKNLIDRNKNRKIDTEEEFQEIKTYLENNQENLNKNDKTLLTNMMDSFQKDTKIVVNIKGNNNNVQVIVGDNNTTTINELPEVTPEKTTETVEETEEVTTEVSKKPEETPKQEPKAYKVRKGDYWYKMVKENYNAASEGEIQQIIRKLKDEYFNKNRANLIKQGHSSSKSGFFLKVGETFNLPQEVELNGKTIKLK